MMDRMIDVWMQQPTERHSADPMFASLRRWAAKTPRPPIITPEMTIAAMDQGGVAIGLAAAWCAPHGWMISPEEARPSPTPIREEFSVWQAPASRLHGLVKFYMEERGAGMRAASKRSRTPVHNTGDGDESTRCAGNLQDRARLSSRPRASHHDSALS